MVYIVLEIQSDDIQAGTLVTSFTDKNKAESKFHTVLSAAAISSVPIHSAVLLTDMGKTLKTETYKHQTEE